MEKFAVAMDLGTSGFRAQALELPSRTVLSTAITTHHPLPGANVIDHLHFSLELGVEAARDLIVQAVNQVLGQLRIAMCDVVRLAVCGNPTQLSLFQGMEIRDLAFAGSRKLERLDLQIPTRRSAVRRAGEFPGLELPGDCDVIIPPAVHDEVGADALALVLQSGILQCQKTAIAIDYGTNAEMVLAHQGRLFTASAAAGPALEGQHISCGTLAVPGAISDLQPTQAGTHRLLVLNADMQPTAGTVIDLRRATEIEHGSDSPAKAITGTGVIAALDQALEAGIIVLPRIQTVDHQLHFGNEIFLTETDMGEAGKAIGAIRAGYFTLSLNAGITPVEIEQAYLAGASGTYVDAGKSGRLGLIPPGVARVKQVGNTSLAMARELATEPEKLEEMEQLADTLRSSHCMFAKSETFAKIFLLELSHWTEGMPMTLYREMLQRYQLPDLPPRQQTPEIERVVKRDIDDPGRLGLVTLEQIGRVAAAQLQGCLGCLTCMESCPTGAISIDKSTQPPTISLAHALCNGVACRRCEPGCEPKVFRLEPFFRNRAGER
jgi:methylamine methyltransferase corrinoid protein reductive activase